MYLGSIARDPHKLSHTQLLVNSAVHMVGWYKTILRTGADTGEAMKAADIINQAMRKTGLGPFESVGQNAHGRRKSFHCGIVRIWTTFHDYREDSVSSLCASKVYNLIVHPAGLRGVW